MAVRVEEGILYKMNYQSLETGALASALCLSWGGSGRYRSI